MQLSFDVCLHVFITMSQVAQNRGQHWHYHHLHISMTATYKSNDEKKITRIPVKNRTSIYTKEGTTFRIFMHIESSSSVFFLL